MPYIIIRIKSVVEWVRLHFVMGIKIFIYALTYSENSIVQRMKKALSTNLTSEQELKRICASLSVTPDELTTMLPQLREEELKRLDSISRSPGTVLVLLIIKIFDVCTYHYSAEQKYTGLDV